MLAVAETAEAILAAVVAWYADPDHAADPLPGRQYVAAGDPRAVAWDCDDGQVTVALGTSALAARSDLTGPVTITPGRNRNTQLLRFGTYELQVVRPTPKAGYSGQAPDADILSAHGVSLMRDVAQVIACLNDAQTRGRMLPEGHGPAPVQVPLIEVLGPTGDLAGIAATIVIELL